MHTLAYTHTSADTQHPHHTSHTSSNTARHSDFHVGTQVRTHGIYTDVDIHIHTHTHAHKEQTNPDRSSQDLRGALRVAHAQGHHTPRRPPRPDVPSPEAQGHPRAATRTHRVARSPPARRAPPAPLPAAGRPPGPPPAVPPRSRRPARRKGGSERGGVAGGGGAGTALPEPPARVIKNPQTARRQDPARRRPAWAAGWTRARAPGARAAPPGPAPRRGGRGRGGGRGGDTVGAGTVGGGCERSGVEEWGRGGGLGSGCREGGRIG